MTGAEAEHHRGAAPRTSIPRAWASPFTGAVREADIAVAAVGRPPLIRGQDIVPGGVGIEARYNLGDVGSGSAVERASPITPVPGGVGPVTLAMLLERTVGAAARQLGVAEG